MILSADAMNEVAWCYLEGFGTKKDKVSRLFSSCHSRCQNQQLPFAPAHHGRRPSSDLGNKAFASCSAVACSVAQDERWAAMRLLKSARMRLATNTTETQFLPPPGMVPFFTARRSIYHLRLTLWVLCNSSRPQNITVWLRRMEIRSLGIPGK